MYKKVITEIFHILSKEYTGRLNTQLKYNNPFELLVSVILSARVNDIAVNKVTEELFKVADTPSKMFNLGSVKIADIIKRLGLYKNKSAYLIGMSEKILKDFDGKVPRNFDDLITLPGVGRKTANVVLNVLYSDPVIAVDTHVFRVSKRIGLSSYNTAEKVEKEITEKIPKKFLRKAHFVMLCHGKEVCKASNPRCFECKINVYCQFYKSQKS